jgi:hypothetical protein
VAWRVKHGVKVAHDGIDYVGGYRIPCSDEQAATMPHAVELAEAAPVEPEKPAAMVAEVPAEALEAKAGKKRGK